MSASRNTSPLHPGFSVEVHDLDLRTVASGEHLRDGV